MVDGYNIGARNQHADSGAYEFHTHRAYIIYARINTFPRVSRIFYVALAIVFLWLMKLCDICGSGLVLYTEIIIRSGPHHRASARGN